MTRVGLERLAAALDEFAGVGESATEIQRHSEDPIRE